VELPAISEWNPEAISAGAACITAAVALAAAVFAYFQWRDLRATRREQAQAFVVISLEVSKASPIFLDLIVRNLGTTIAHDVTFDFDPPLVSTFERRENRRVRDAPVFKEGIKTFPPGGAHRVTIARGPDLLEDESIPRRYRAVASFTDRWGERQHMEYQLDAELYTGFTAVHIYGEHDAAKALMDVSRTLDKWTERHGRDGVRVWVRDEEAYLEELERAEREREERYLADQMRSEQAAGPSSNASEAAAGDEG
jgi:hypothetical protein